MAPCHASCSLCVRLRVTEPTKTNPQNTQGLLMVQVTSYSSTYRLQTLRHIYIGFPLKLTADLLPQILIFIFFIFSPNPLFPEGDKTPNPSHSQMAPSIQPTGTTHSSDFTARSTA
ncbi:hypothetical protein HAX54_049799, partial [Datura stramonium]|nr:hypothetical protein [Datura stramonium]